MGTSVGEGLRAISDCLNVFCFKSRIANVSCVDS